MTVGEMILLDGLLGADAAWIISFVTYDCEETETVDEADGLLVELLDGPHEGELFTLDLSSIELGTRH